MQRHDTDSRQQFQQVCWSLAWKFVKSLDNPFHFTGINIYRLNSLYRVYWARRLRHTETSEP